MPRVGLEPTRLAAGDFESPASTNFAIRATSARERILTLRQALVNSWRSVFFQFQRVVVQLLAVGAADLGGQRGGLLGRQLGGQDFQHA